VSGPGLERLFPRKPMPLQPLLDVLMALLTLALAAALGFLLARGRR
jgi:hypothetical protein